MRGSVLVFWCIVVITARAWAEPALDKPAFTATPQELLAAAKAAPADDDITILREDIVDEFDGRKRLTDRWRLIAAIRTQKGADSWDTLSGHYAVGRQDRPALRVRVVDASGKVVEADPKLAVDEPQYKTPGATSDAHEVSLAMPKLSVGAVVEEEMVTIDREPTTPAGSSRRIQIESDREPRVTVSAPVALGMHRLERSLGGVHGKRVVANGVETWTYTFARRPWVELDTWVPSDAYQRPWLGFSTNASWTALASALRTIADRQLAAGPISLPAELTRGATLANARAVTAWLQHHVRQDDVPVDATPFLPAPPAETLRTGTANDLSLAFALVALLQKADIPAELALVDLGAGPDAEPELAMYGWFDRALVRARIANADVWIDPTADAFRAGVLPWSDRHRRVLVIAPGTTGLTPIPASAPADNVIHETRTFEFSGDGGARITEVRREGGMFEGEDRAWFRDQSRDDVTKQLTDNLTKRYVVDKIAKWSTTDAADLSAPFESTSVVESSQRAVAEREKVDAWVFPSAALSQVPDVLRQKEVVRRADFEWYRPHVYEVENRFVIPDGYTMPTIADETRVLGTTKLIRTVKVAGRVFTVSFRFASGKVRLTPGEVDETRTAILGMIDEGLHLVFPSTIRAQLDRGKAVEAIAEAHRLIAAYPKAGKFHAQLAEALIGLGLGDAGRREAKAAVQLEPNNADLHAVLGWVLVHDTVGRIYTGDFDHAGARTALERARKLQPTHAGAAAALGELLQYDSRGRLNEGTDRKSSLQAWRAAFERDDSDVNADGVMRALLWADDGAELARFARARPAGTTRDSLLIAGVALASGAAAALQEAGNLSPESTRKTAMTNAAGVLLYTRHYEQMNALFDALGAFPKGSVQANVMHALRRIDQPIDRKTPTGAVLEANLDVFSQDPSKGYWDVQTEEEVGDEARAMLAQIKMMFPRAVLADVVRSSMKGNVEGDPRAWRVDFDLQGTHSQTYAVQDHGTIKVIGSNTAVMGVGRHVLRSLANNDMATARRLLDWLAKDTTHYQRTMRVLWGPNHGTDRATLEIAGATLAGATDPTHALPIVEKCEGAMGDTLAGCASTVFAIDSKLLAWKDLDAAATARLAAKPGDRLGTEMKATAQARLGNTQEADRIVDAALLVTPDDKALQQLHAQIPAIARDLVEAMKRARALAASNKAMLNDEAWMDLLANTDLQDGLAKAQQAVQASPKIAAFHHTLAALEAEVGDLQEASSHLREAIRLRRDQQPHPQDWYVIGRIAERLGYRADAIAAYHRVKADPHVGLPQTSDLAQRRLAVLGVP